MPHDLAGRTEHPGPPGLLGGGADMPAWDAVSAQALERPAWWPRLAAMAAAQPPPAPAWAHYWQARAHGLSGPAEARQHLEAAHHRFNAEGHPFGAWACAVAAVESFYFDEASLEPLQAWVTRLVAHPAPANDGLLAHGMRCGPGLLLHSLDHPLVAAWTDQAPTLLGRLLQPGSRARVAAFLLLAHLLRGESARVDWVIDATPGLDTARMPPDDALLWHDTVARHARARGDFARGRRACHRSLALAKAAGLPRLRYSLEAMGGYLAIAERDAPATVRHLQAMKAVLAAEPLADPTHYWHLQTGLALLQGEQASALRLAELTLEHSARVGSPQHLAYHRASLGTVLLALGRADEASSLLADVAAQAQALGAAHLQFSVELLASRAQAQAGPGPGPGPGLSTGTGTEAADASLARGLALAAQHDFRSTVGWWQPDWAADRLARALTLGLAPDTARRLARQWRLPGPDPRLAAWPWPLTMRLFGPFQAWAGDTALPAGRPLDLLRCLACLGGEAGAQRLMALLWPESDGPAQRRAFDSNLLRLRRLLGDDRPLQLTAGRLRLDEAFAWSDLAAFQRAAETASAPGPSATVLQAAEDLLALARAPLLEGDEEPWALAARERCRRRFAQALTAAAQRLAEAGAPTQGAAAPLLQRALEADPLSEPVARALILLHLGAGQRGEAQRIWRQTQALMHLAGPLGTSESLLALAHQHGL